MKAALVLFLVVYFNIDLIVAQTTTAETTTVGWNPPDANSSKACTDFYKAKDRLTSQHYIGDTVSNDNGMRCFNYIQCNKGINRDPITGKPGNAEGWLRKCPNGTLWNTTSETCVSCLLATPCYQISLANNPVRTEEHCKLNLVSQENNSSMWTPSLDDMMKMDQSDPTKRCRLISNYILYALDGLPNLYIRMYVYENGTKHYEKVSCGIVATFDTATCGCKLPKPLMLSEHPFDLLVETKGYYYYVNNQNVKIDHDVRRYGNGSAKFNGTSRLVIPHYDNSFPRQVCITLWLKIAADVRPSDEMGIISYEKCDDSTSKPALRLSLKDMKVTLETTLLFPGNATNAAHKRTFPLTNGHLLSSTKWSFVCIIFDGRSLRLVVDENIAEEDLTSDFSFAAEKARIEPVKRSLIIGMACSNPTLQTWAPYRGHIDSFNVFNHALTMAETDRVHNDIRLDKYRDI